jgi:Tol biopolymer transport system component
MNDLRGAFSVAALAVAISWPGVAREQDPAVTAGVREAAWSPDGKRVAVSWFDAVWTMTPEGRDARRLAPKPEGWIVERDPAWSADGKSIAFSASTNGHFDIWITPASGGTARRLTSASGDERWPSWTRDGRIVYSHRPDRGAWQLMAAAADGAGTPQPLTPAGAGEWQGRVSPDGKLVAFISDRDADRNNEADTSIGASHAGARE